LLLELYPIPVNKKLSGKHKKAVLSTIKQKETVFLRQPLFCFRKQDDTLKCYICAFTIINMAKIGINIATGSLQQQEMIVGIDLGTTNSLVAIIHPESRRPVVLKEHDGNALVPSVIHFGEYEVVSVGDDAKKYLIGEPQTQFFLLNG
jgi:Molecular chaperone